MKRRRLLLGALLGAATFASAQETKIDEVSIAARSPQQLYETGKPVTLLTAADLDTFRGQSLSNILDQLPGVQISGNFNNETEPKSMKIRGGTSANVLILVDGVPMKDVTGNDYTAADLRLIPAENVESIEMLNGASSVLYGSNATVAVINIKLKKSAKKTVEGIISARGGSFDTYAQNAALRGDAGGFTYQLSAQNEKSGGLSSALGDKTFDKDGFEKQNFSGNIGYKTGNFTIGLDGGHSHNLYKYDDGAFADGLERGNDNYNYGGLHASYAYRNGETVLNARFTGNTRIGSTLQNDAYQDQFSYSGHSLYTEIFNRYRFSDMINVVAGINYESDRMGSKSLPWGAAAMQDVLISDQAKLSNFDAFVNVNFKYQGFHLDGGARLTEQSKFGNHWVYSVNPYYLQDLGTAYVKGGFSFATAFIAPTIYQGYGSLPYILPNFDLKPETNESTEIDLEFGKKDGSLKISGSLYRRHEKNVFAYETVDLKTFAGEYENVDSNTVKGADIALKYRICPYISLGGSYSYVEKSNAATMLRQPKQRINSYLEISPAEKTRLTLSQVYAGARADSYYDAASYSVKNVTDAAYTIFNLNISQAVFKNFDAFANIGNLFNKSYTDIVGYTTKPRNYTVGFSYKF